MLKSASPIGLVALAAFAVSIPNSALAWEHLRQKWIPEDMPYEYQISDYIEDSIESGYPQYTAIPEGYAAWDVAECADIQTVFDDLTTENLPTTFDYYNRHSFDDPNSLMAPGILAWTLNFPGLGVGAPVDNIDGQTYYRILDSDIVFNDNVDWATEDQITSGSCNGETSMQAVATHEIGHQMGLAHSCEQEDACSNPDFLEATMYWTASGCDSAQATPESDDIDSLTALYGPSASFKCSHELDPASSDTIAMGVVDFDLRCTTMGKFRNDITDVTWYFGDGGTSTDLDPTHTYTEAGNYTVRACYTGVSANDTCGEWEFCSSKEGYVRACDIPEVEFTVSHIDGRTFQFLNETNLSVYGCIYDVQWDVFLGGTQLASLAAWEPQYTFEEDGEYTVVLNVGGPAGVAAQELSFEVKNHRGEGYGTCNTAGGAAGLGGLLIAFGLLGVRRRRS